MASEDITPKIDQIVGFSEVPDKKKAGSLYGKHLGAKPFTNPAEGRYELIVPMIGVILRIDRLRRERHDLIGELSVFCELAGAKTVDGWLTIADFNLSSTDARTKRANILAARSMAHDVDWAGLVEELCQRVILAERVGHPAIDLATHPKPDMARQHFSVLNLAIPQRHPSILFGDGGSAKSYLALYIAGQLSRETKVGYFDWELDADEHRHRLEQLYTLEMPNISYLKCDKALVHDLDHITRVVRDEGIDFAIFDSIVFACAGPPETSEVAAEYFRAVRRLNIGSLHVAHVNKSETGDMKPFGSIFWHNGARATWNVKRDDGLAQGDCLPLTLYTRKANTGPLGVPVNIDVRFDRNDVLITQTERRNTDATEKNPTLAKKIANLLKTHGPMTAEQLTQHTTESASVLRGTMNRELGTMFEKQKGGKLLVFKAIQ